MKISISIDGVRFNLPERILVKKDLVIEDIICLLADIVLKDLRWERKLIKENGNEIYFKE